MMLSSTMMLAETKLAEISLQYREEVAASAKTEFWYLLVPIAAVAIGLAVYKIVNRPPPIVNTPQGMLHELCRAHRIGTRGRLLLDRIADEAELEQPATMLLGVSQFEIAVKKASQHIKFDTRQQATLGMIRRRMFA